MPDLGSTEFTMLWASAILGAVYLLAAAVPSVLIRGLPWALGPRDEAGANTGKVGARLDRAWKNFLETFPIFAVAILVTAHAPHNAGLSALGAQLYFWARVAYLPVYALGIPVVRTLVWTVSLVGIALVLASAIPGV